MRIENIIEDIIQDTVDIKNALMVQLHQDKPQLMFTVVLPELEKLSFIKVVELSFREQHISYTLRAEIHTHNGFRVFEMECLQRNNSISNDPNYFFLQKWFIDLLRGVIKKVKHLKRAGKFNKGLIIVR